MMITLYSFTSAFGRYTDSSSTAQLSTTRLWTDPIKPYIQNPPLPEDASADLIHPCQNTSGPQRVIVVL